MANIPITQTNYGTTSGGPVGTVADTSLPGTFIVQQGNTNSNLVPSLQTAAGTADAVTFANAVNICIFTSTGPDAATLAMAILVVYNGFRSFAVGGTGSWVLSEV